MHPIDTSRVIGNSVLALSMLARLASPIELIIGSYQELPGTRNRKRIKPKHVRITKCKRWGSRQPYGTGHTIQASTRPRFQPTSPLNGSYPEESGKGAEAVACTVFCEASSLRIQKVS